MVSPPFLPSSSFPDPRSQPLSFIRQCRFGRSTHAFGQAPSAFSFQILPFEPL
ncbi:hypothetical protein M408DRAFT_329562 [Serendipita vermifera MAFF 305830]|uniref:Uncharacterized protein n=1 Tax=Serendipita vermifera MAFF 305830 TaxID=933852 RepID=A0A0C3B9S7_SERVB|nr:hypothetical protein M408DRAFT_329562 [Serendipita vermifera MAFF 305830]